MTSLALANSAPIAFLIIAVVFLAWLAVLTITVLRLSRARRAVMSAVRGEADVVEVISKAVADVERLFSKHDQVALACRQNRAVLGATIKHIGLVRYDAFPEVGGRLSFSAALLNEKGDGLVLTSINGRSDSRVYAKPIIDRLSSFSLSEEEEKAITEAYKEVEV